MSDLFKNPQILQETAQDICRFAFKECECEKKGRSRVCASAESAAIGILYRARLEIESGFNIKPKTKRSAK
jgi:hypothetical protein